jgi:hypothetical protein
MDNKESTCSPEREFQQVVQYEFNGRVLGAEYVSAVVRALQKLEPRQG